MKKEWLENKWILMVLAGIIILVLAMPGSSSDTKSSSFLDGSSSSNSELEHMEQRIGEALSMIDGIGKTKVVLSTQQETNELFGSSSQPEISGALIITQSADNDRVVSQITEVMEALFGVPAHKIIVMKMNKEG
ncbi:MAG: hypothetical protein ACI4CT_00390 [Lachnospiraceae bacterium]